MNAQDDRFGKKPEQVDRLIDAFLDDTVSQEDADELGNWLLLDAANARHFARRSIMHQRLREKLYGEPMAELSIALSEQSPSNDLDFWSLVEALDDRGETTNLQDLTQEYARQDITRSERKRRSIQGWVPEQNDDHRSVVVVIPKLAVIAALVMLVGVIALFVFRSMPEKPESPRMSNQPKITDPNPALPTDVAQVAWSLDAVWADRLARPAKAQMRSGVYTLEKGFVEIAFDRGASAIIQGPATFELINDNTTRLASGRLTAHVPEEATGFTVISPRARVVDMGTDFGVEVEENGATTAAVFAGRVELFAEPADGEVNLHPDNVRSITLSKGWQARVDENAILDETSVRIDPTRHFLRDRSDVLYRPIIAGAGRFVRDAPLSLAMGQFVDADRVTVLLERVSTTLPKPVRRVVTQPGKYAALSANRQNNLLAAGLPCDSYLLHFDPGVDDVDALAVLPIATVTLTFPRPILGVITVGDELFATDPFCAKPGMGLPARSDFEDGKGFGRGIDVIEDSQDMLELSEDRRTLTISLQSSLIDQVRVLTEPAGKTIIEP